MFKNYTRNGVLDTTSHGTHTVLSIVYCTRKAYRNAAL